MNEGVSKNGFPSWNELLELGFVPSEQRLRKGPVAFIECVQQIPCNPCESACPFHAIEIKEPIINLPKLDMDKCTGCGKCIAQCPGLAIFVVDMTYNNTEATISFPHEYLPLPAKGQMVAAVNRAGEKVCQGRVIQVAKPVGNDHTPVITIAVPNSLIHDVRGIKRLGYDIPATQANLCMEAKPTNSDDIIVCRCEEVSLGDIRKAISEGATTIAAIKRRTRAGMGLCQGRTCSRIISGILKEMVSVNIEPLPDTARTPIKPIPLGLLADDVREGFDP